uniref:WD_REPEATS_REGION domain-containing protein n=1 Tax=Mesocestoides corti TaxID=53468 RepID=A0A5K3ESF0_MESCO
MSNGGAGLDGLMTAERDELMERVAYLEKQTTDQAEELTCLKSALADCLRRVQVLETSRGTHSPSRRTTASRTASESRAGKMPSGPTPYPTGRQTRHMPRLPAASTMSSASKRPPSQVSLRTTTNVGLPSPSSAAAPGLKVGGSSGSGTLARPPTSSSKSGSREPTYLRDEGLLRTYLRGRCLNFYAPTDVASDYDFSAVLDVPEEQLKLEWVYGYRGRDCRNNVYLLPTGEVIYFVAAVVVLYNIEQHSQRHYLGHNDDIKCIAVHPDKITIASGQTAGHAKAEGRPHVRIWNSVSLETLQVLGLGVFENSVACLSFSKTDGGAILAVIDEANDHTISLWEWQKTRRLTETKSLSLCQNSPPPFEYLASIHIS